MEPTKPMYKEKQLDLEWILLMKHAKELGFEPSDIKSFLNQFGLNKREKKPL